MDMSEGEDAGETFGIHAAAEKIRAEAAGSVQVLKYPCKAFGKACRTALKPCSRDYFPARPGAISAGPGKHPQHRKRSSGPIAAPPQA